MVCPQIFKSNLFSFILFAIGIVAWSCSAPTQGESLPHVAHIEGEAQGTTYSVKFLNPDSIEVSKATLDSLLRAIDLSLSVWVEESTISVFNRSDTIATADPHFITVFFRGRELSESTGGAFHPMVMPLVRAWGFGPEGGQIKDGINIDSIRALVHYDFTAQPLDDHMYIFAKAPGMQLDVNAYAQGYAVDLLAEYLEGLGIKNYMVEIGGELRASGTNEKGQHWRIGIDKPVEEDEERTLQAIVDLKNASLATSGSYRKFYVKDGKKYAHTINPATGYPVDHNLLSVTVLARNCTNADALATAFLVMGVEGTKGFLQNNPGLGVEVYLIYDDDGLKTYASPGLVSAIEEV